MFIIRYDFLIDVLNQIFYVYQALHVSISATFFRKQCSSLLIIQILALEIISGTEMTHTLSICCNDLLVVSIVTMCVSCTAFNMQLPFGGKSQFLYLTCINTPNWQG